MIIRGKWRSSWKALSKYPDIFTCKERVKFRIQLILMIPLCVIYWLLFSISECLQWAGDKLADAGNWIHDKVWEG